jgi:AcrR family transcriptional regulator
MDRSPTTRGTRSASGGSRRAAGDTGATDSRGKLLEAAVAEFSKRGLDGARVDVIAARAGVNKAMLYHYFKSKEGLYVAVLERTYEAMRERERALDLAHVEPVQGIERLVTFTFTYLLENPSFIALLNDENLHHGRHLRRSRNVRGISASVTDMLAELLARGEAQGVFRKGVDPVQIYLLLAGSCYFYVANAYTLSLVFERDFLAKNARSKFLACVKETTLRYLQP